MRAILLLTASFLSTSALAIDLSPFHSPFNAAPEPEPETEPDIILKLVKREGSCPANHSPCSDLGSSDVCCRSGTVCSQDAGNNIACCPVGAKCTGSLTGSATKTGDSPPSMVTSSGGFMFPAPNPAEPTITGPTLTGAEYPFVIIPTSFQGASECSSYYSGCQNQYTSCTGALGGGVNGVTVAGPGGGVTVAAVSPTGNPQEICSSLQLKACHNLQVGYCTAFGAGGNENFGSRHVVSRDLFDIFGGMIIGVLGMFV
ncbi:hypothetical protein FQN54_002056 [Arachnomyces sp. PD_36]|nr:hypothetical protein FQN54_002056 [Arachnomyces sp. PD_36]